MFLSDAFDMALTWFVYNSYARYPGDPFYWPEGGLEHAKQMRNIVKEEIIDFYFRKSFFYVAKDMLKWYLVDKGWIPNRSGIKKRLVLLTRPGRDEHTVQEMDIYSPTVENIEEKRPVVVFFYGGAWNAGRKEVYRTLGYNLASENYVVCVPNYIQAYFAGKCNHKVCSHGTIDDMKMDILRALKWVKENIIHYNGDPNNIVIVGHSAGAHLTTLALCSSDIGKYFNGLILLNGIFEIQEQFEHDSNR